MIAGILFLSVFLVGLVVGSIMARRKHPPVDSARFGAAVQHLYGEGQQRRAPGALEIKPMTARPRPPSRGQRAPDVTVKVHSTSKRPMPVK